MSEIEKCRLCGTPGRSVKTPTGGGMVMHHFEPTGLDAQVRPEVFAFALAMEAELKANDHKGGWQNEPVEILLDRLDEEVKELWWAVRHDRNKGYGLGHFDITGEAADVGNFAMMIADVTGRLTARAAHVGKEAGE